MNGKLIIFSAPSGSGKTTLVKYLLAQRSDLAFSVSCTTRSPRPNEIHGQDYYFLSPETFDAHVQNNEFVEWEEVYQGIRYGTLMAEIERIWSSGHHVVFDIDVQGGINLKNKFKDRALSIFIQSPSLDVLRQRLTDRNTETPEKLAQRVEKAAQEMDHAPLFDNILINDDLATAQSDLLKLVDGFISDSF